jgi:ferritin-like metal-binding protein YciE
MQDLYLETLQDLYSAETQIIKALPEMIDAAKSTALKNAFSAHLKQTEQHAKRLEQIVDKLGDSPKGKTCKGMEGLLKEGKEILKEEGTPEVLDAALIGAAQKVEHYEISGYGTARTLAQLVGDKEGAKLLDQTAQEEGQADKLLTQIAEQSVNNKAKQA